MVFLNNWIESLDYEFRISDLCSCYQSPRSTCCKCLDACLDDAITLIDGKPSINNEKCTECGYCIAECPVQAIEGFLPKRMISHNQFFVTGERPPAIKELLRYYQKGVTTIVYERKSLNDNWQETVSKANDILEKLNEEPFTISGKRIEAEEETYTRREIFLVWKKQAQSTMTHVTPAKWRFNHESMDLTKFFPNYQFVKITVDTNKCTLCKACQMLCSKKSIQIDDTHFAITAKTCSSCMLCRDICPEKAISIQEKIIPTTDTAYPIYNKKCQTCMDSFQTVKKHEETCNVCKKRKKYGVFLK